MQQASERNFSYGILPGLALVYFGIAEAGHLLSLQAGQFATFWPPAGFYLAVLATTARRHWPSVISIFLLANLASDVGMHRQPAWVSLTFWLGNTLAAWGGATLLQNVSGGIFQLKQVQQILWLGLIGALAPVVSATIGAGALRLAYGSSYSQTWGLWWSADMLGILLAAPLSLAVANAWRVPPQLPLRQLLEAALLLVLVLVSTVLIFGGYTPWARAAFILPLLLWAALRFGVGVTALAMLALAVMAIRLTSLGRGPLLPADSVSRVFVLQTSLGIFALTKLLIAVLFAEHKRAERALREANTQLEERVAERTRELRENREWFRTTLTSIGDAVIATDAAGNVTFINQIASQLTGWSPEEAPGLPLEKVFHIINESSREVVENPVTKVIRHGAVVGLANHTLLITRTGQEIPIDDSGAPIYSPQGELTGVVLVFRDISERKAIEQEREISLAREQRLRQQAEQANRLKDEFLATVSHELRTPLNHMLGWVQLLRNGAVSHEETGHALEVIERNARTQNRLIEDLLDMSRVISGHLRLELKPVAINQVIGAAIEAMQPAADNRGVLLETSLDPRAGTVAGDATRLQQVIWNLVSNAVKFTPSGGRVSVCSLRTSKGVTITVQDTGQGISPEFLPYVFDRFSQQDGSFQRRHGGLGLGLAIVRHLVELHGGTVLAESEGLEQGALFRLELPATLPATAPGAYAPDPATFTDGGLSGLPALSATVLSGLRLLVVDDEADTRQLLTSLLTPTGAQVQTAASTQEALELLANQSFDLLIADLAMPEADGYELIQRVRASERARAQRLPAVALTAYARSEDRLRALSTGYQMHLVKPVEPAELITVLASLSGRLMIG